MPKFRRQLRPGRFAEVVAQAIHAACLIGLLLGYVPIMLDIVIATSASILNDQFCRIITLQTASHLCWMVSSYLPLPQERGMKLAFDFGMAALWGLSLVSLAGFFLHPNFPTEKIPGYPHFRLLALALSPIAIISLLAGLYLTLRRHRQAEANPVSEDERG